MFQVKRFLHQTAFLLFLAWIIIACTITPISSSLPTSAVVLAEQSPTSILTQILSPTLIGTITPIQIATPAPSATQDAWKIQHCIFTSSITESMEGNWLWEYNGDQAESGNVMVQLNFTTNNEILGFYFDLGQVREYKIRGCIAERYFIMWLFTKDENNIEARIEGEFPKADPRSQNPSDKILQEKIITGILTSKTSERTYAVYLKLESGISGTLNHRFQIAGVKDDDLILNASKNFLTAVANDEREHVTQMLRFPLEVYKQNGIGIEIQTSKSFLTQYEEIINDDLKERLAKTIPGNMQAYAGNHLGEIGLNITGGGVINFDENGKVQGIFDWKPTVIITSALTPSTTPDASTPTATR